MSKSQKILSILFIILLFATTLSLATDINMNLDLNTTGNDTIVSEENTIFNETTENAIENSVEPNVNTNIPSTIVSDVSSVSNEGLTLTNILNILLIVVGVVLILLGIAILIRMHS